MAYLQVSSMSALYILCQLMRREMLHKCKADRWNELATLHSHALCNKQKDGIGLIWNKIGDIACVSESMSSIELVLYDIHGWSVTMSRLKLKEY